MTKRLTIFYKTLQCTKIYRLSKPTPSKTSGANKNMDYLWKKGEGVKVHNILDE